MSKNKKKLRIYYIIKSMIVSCPNSNKRINIDQKLIPENGRILQCSSCMHKWHYKINEKEEVIKEIIKSKNVINKNKEDSISINTSKTPKKQKKTVNKQKINKEIKLKDVVVKDIKKKQIRSKKTEIPLSLSKKVFVLFISLAALVLILDTFKVEFSRFFPFIIPILDSFYDIIFDISSFIKHLIR